MQLGRQKWLMSGLSISVLIMLTGSAAADVKYESKTKVKFEGALGSMMNVLGKLGGAPDEVMETVYVKADKMRTDSEDESTILDLDRNRYITLNHKDKTYMVVTFREMQERFQKMMEEAKEGKEAKEAPEKAEPSEKAEPATTDVKFDLSVDRTGETKKIDGHKADRVIMTLKAEATNVAPQESEQQGLEGTLVTVTDMWMSKDVKGFDEVQEFQKKMGESMGETVLAGGDMSGLMSAFQKDPRMAAAMEKAKEESSKMEGISLLSTTYMVLVPKGVDYQQELVFGSEKDEKKGGGFGGFGKLMKKAMESKLGAESEDEEKTPQEPKQTTVLTVTTALENISTDTQPASLFEIPSDYKEIQFPH
jgi:hypothetical protein